MWDNSGAPGPGATSMFDSFVALALQTVFALSAAPATPAAVLCFVNGVEYTPAVDFTVVGTVATWLNTDFSLGAGDRVNFFYQV